MRRSSFARLAAVIATLVLSAAGCSNGVELTIDPAIAAGIYVLESVSGRGPAAGSFVLGDGVQAALAKGDVSLPLRTMVPLPNTANVLARMPAAKSAAGVIGAKVIGIFPGNDGTGYDPHPGAVLLFDSVHGPLRSILDAGAINAIPSLGLAVEDLATTQRVYAKA